MRKVVLNKIINSYIEESKKALDTFLEIDKVSILNASKLSFAHLYKKAPILEIVLPFFLTQIV